MLTMFKEVNKDLLPMKGHYFFWNAGTGSVVTFLSTYAKQLGFSSVIVGTIYTILPICGMIAKPLMGAIADRFHCQKKIFLIFQLLTAIAFLSIFYAPEIPLDRQVHLSCDSAIAFNTYNISIDSSLIKQLQSSGVATCNMDCVSSPRFLESFCNYNYCNISGDTKNLNFEAYVPKSLTILASGDAYFRISNISVQGSPVFAPKCDKLVTSTCNIFCNDFTLNEVLTKNTIQDSEVFKFYEFWVFLMMMICAWVGQAIVVSIGDAICFEMLGDRPERYGHQRCFGSLGWGIISILVGFIIDATSEGSAIKNYVWAFYLSTVFLLLDFGVSYRLPYTQKKRSPSILKDVAKLLMDVRIFVFLLWCVFVGLCTSLVWNFLFWLIEDLAKAQDMQSNVKTLEGLVSAIQCLLGELPLFFLSGAILKRIGHVHAMSLVLLILGLRFILYSVIPNPWWFLPIELSNGLTFGLFYSTMASYASIVAPPGTEATMQGMVGAVFEGVGVSLGSFVAGILFKEHGGAMCFRMFGIGSLVACLLHASVQFLLSRKDYETKYAHPTEGLAPLEEEDVQEMTYVYA
ncbi:unnamed protein product [Brassicogethes aeneus]|uniref:Major facilitator superfamily associated domain-containing protein n=1 Tax=Brassicogethes aeneus TaxID=1431903 RepID=A0A9P0FAT9_BRAAE|nr:unnamed protein product [Brassicogethes aeneus]